jgi:hypothetical protein
MSFKPISMEDQSSVESGVVQIAETVRAYADALIRGFEAFYAHDYNRRKWGVTFTAGEQLRSSIQTPFGEARGAFELVIRDRRVEGRYVFQKSILSESGDEVWKSVWSMRISEHGNVYLGDEDCIEVDIDSTGPHNKAFGAAARSLLFTLGNTPTFR